MAPATFWGKPLDVAELLAAVRRALEKRRRKAALPVFHASRPLLGTLDGEPLIPEILAVAQRTLRASGAALVQVAAEKTGQRVHLSPDHGVFTTAAAECLADVALRAGEPVHRISFAGESGNMRRTKDIRQARRWLIPWKPATRWSGRVLVESPGAGTFLVSRCPTGELLADEVVVALDNARSAGYGELAIKANELKVARGGAARAEARARRHGNRAAGHCPRRCPRQSHH